jgi:hypothetical protein
VFTVPRASPSAIKRAALTAPPPYLLRLLIAGGVSKADAIDGWRSLAPDLAHPNMVDLGAMLTNAQVTAGLRETARILRDDARGD